MRVCDMPAQPPIMAAGFFVILGGLIHPALGQVFGWFAWPFLVWTTAIVEGVSALPFAAFDTGTLPLWPMVVYYVLLGAGGSCLGSSFRPRQALAALRPPTRLRLTVNRCRPLKLSRPRLACGSTWATAWCCRWCAWVMIRRARHCG